MQYMCVDIYRDMLQFGPKYSIFPFLKTSHVNNNYVIQKKNGNFLSQPFPLWFTPSPRE